ncbi:MAG: hypothetical protein FWC40_07960 [Proteobacteria bacterium]|nr:hypothetical protein [Pseudomonadota bacterium]
MEKTTKTDQILEKKSDDMENTSLSTTDEEEDEVFEKSFETRLNDAMTAYERPLTYKMIQGASDEADLRAIATNSAMMHELMKLLKGNMLHRCLDRLYVHVDDVDVLKACIKARFDVNLGATSKKGKEFKAKALGGTEEAWTLVGAQGVYRSLLLLPKVHVDKVNDILTQNTVDGSSGVARPSLGCINVNYSADPNRLVSSTNYCDTGDAQCNLRLLDTLVIHEIGHIIDKGQKYSGRSDFRKISGWKDEGKEPAKVAKAIEGYACTHGYTQPLTQDERAIRLKGAEFMIEKKVIKESDIGDQVSRAFHDLKKNPTGEVGVYRNLADLTTEFKSSKLYTHILHSWAEKFPWNNGKQSCMSRQIHESYPGKSWYSFAHTAFDNKISKYQLRDPGEEFAELYATYHVATPKGDGLKAEHKAWFEKMGLHKK